MATFTNQAILTYNNTTTTSNIVEGELVEVLSATKTAVNQLYGHNDAVTYAVSIVNAGTTAFTGLTITDNLGAYSFNATTLTPLDYVADSVRYYSNGVLQAAPGVTAGPPLAISGISVPAGGNALILYSARSNEFAPLDSEGEIDNTATITGGGLSAPLVATATVHAKTGVRLSIHKSVCPASVTENEPLTYTLTIQNSGNIPVVASDNVIVSDTFDPVLTITAVRFNGAVWTSPANYSYNAATGLFTTAAGQITVPAATYTRNAATGAWNLTPGTSTLTISGTI